MATTLFTAWYPDVSPYVNSCPLPVQLQKIREAAIAFCKMSRTWRYLGLTAIDAVANQQTYVIGAGAAVGTLPAETVIAHVFQANYNGRPLDVVTPKDFRGKSDTWFDDKGDPECMTLFNEGELSLWMIPEASAVGAIRVPEVALAPSQVATGLDSRIYETYREVIAKGARALIHQIKGKPYTDVQLGMALEQEFKAESGSADLRAASGRGHARLRTRTIYR